MSILVQLLLPRKSREKANPSPYFKDVRDELTAKFGGVTVYSRASAEGLWESEGGVVEQDEMVLFEVMAEKLQKRWWRNYRQLLEARFEQTEIVIRAHRMTRL